MKFLHTVGAVGFMGGMAALLVMASLPQAHGGAPGSAALIGAMARIAAWIVGPSMVVTVVAGLLAMAANPAYLDVGWVWVKTATGILIFEGGLHVLGPLQDEAKRGAGALGASDPSTVGRMLSAEGATLWMLLAVSLANIALGVWRPRLPKTSG